MWQMQMLPPPANLASPCEPLPNPPQPAIDPERLIWEVGVVSSYADCATRHRLAIEAWKEISKPAPKKSWFSLLRPSPSR
jgi:hypothetical protein